MEIPSLARYLPITETFDVDRNSDPSGLLMEIGTEVGNLEAFVMEVKDGSQPMPPMETAPALETLLSETTLLLGNLNNIEYRDKWLSRSIEMLARLEPELRALMLRQKHHVFTPA